MRSDLRLNAVTVCDASREQLLPARMPLMITGKCLQSDARPLSHGAPSDQQALVAKERETRREVVATPATSRSVDLLQFESGGRKEGNLACHSVSNGELWVATLRRRPERLARSSTTARRGCG